MVRRFTVRDSREEYVCGMEDSLRREPNPITQLTGVGLAIAAAAVAAVLILGLTPMSATTTTPFFDTSLTSSYECGTVFRAGPDKGAEGVCADRHRDRWTLLLVVGVPGVVLGLGIAWASVIEEEWTIQDDENE